MISFKGFSTEPSPKSLTLVSPSRISAYLECPKKYDYIYGQELKPAGKSAKKFDKGNYFHELSHVYYQMIKSGVEPGSTYAEEAIKARIRNDIETTGDPSLISVYGIVTTTMLRFIREQSKKVDHGIQVISVEAKLEFPTEDFVLFGFADLIYRDHSGNLRIRDHKTGEKAWGKLDAQFSNQLLYYACIVWKLMGEVPMSEISYTNTKEYAKPITYEQAFTFTTVNYSERELQIYFDEICRVVVHMLQSDPVPFYGQHCRYCAFQTPCYLSRKGIDASPILAANYTKRDSRHESTFTESYAKSDNPN